MDANYQRIERVLALARRQGISRYRLKSKVAKLVQFLEPGEEVVEVGYGRAGEVFIGGLTGKVLIGCTDRRVVLPSVVWGQALRFDDLASVASKTYPTMGHLELYRRDGRRVVFKEIQPKRGAQALEHAIRERIEATFGRPHH